MFYFLLIYFFAGILTGLLSSLFGFGGGFVVVPLLFWLLPFEGVPTSLAMHMAIGTSLVIMIFNATYSSFLHYKKGNVVLNIFFAMAPFLSIGAIVGAILAGYINGNILRYLFILFLAYTLILAFLKSEFFENKTLTQITMPSKMSLVFFSVTTGAIASLLGIGGSVMTVPFLRRRHMPMANASGIATSLSIPIALVGSTTYMLIGSKTNNLPSFSSGYLYWPAFLGIISGSIFGARFGTGISNKIPDHFYAKIYIVLLFIVMFSMFLR